jgi:hypothetical protein
MNKLPDYDQLTREIENEIDWSTHYQGGKCPDCGEEIPKHAKGGDDCLNCEHVFWTTTENDEARRGLTFDKNHLHYTHVTDLST